MKTIGEKVDKELSEIRDVVCRDYCKYYQELFLNGMNDDMFDKLLDEHCYDCPMGQFGY